MRTYQIEVETRSNLFNTCMDASVVKGPTWAKDYRSVQWAPTREEAFAKVTESLTKRFPQHAFEFTHTAA